MAISRIVQILVKVAGRQQVLALGKNIGKLGAATTVAATALGALAITTAKGRRELELLAKQANLTAGDFKSLAFATTQFGVEAENLADISKDLSDRLGEFASLGTGAFDDFVNVVGLTKAEGIELAKELQYLSSDEVLGRLVFELENAGASGAETTFVLESLGNDLSKLVPLFANNSAKLKELREQFDAVNDTFRLTQEESQKLAELATKWDIFTNAVDGAAQKFTASVADGIIAFLDEIILKLPVAAQNLSNFINDLLGFEAIEIEFDVVPSKKGKGKDQGQTAISQDIRSIVDSFKKAQQERIKDIEVTNEQILLAQNGFIAEQEALINIDTERQLRALRAQREEILKQIGQTNFERLKVEEDYQAARVAIENNAAIERGRVREEEAKMARLAAVGNVATIIAGLSQLNEKSKGLQRASIVASTAVAVMKTWEQVGYPWGIPLAAIMAAIGVKQFQQVGKNSISSNAGSGSTANFGQQTFSQLTQVNRVESTELLALRNELSLLDNDEVLPVSFTRRLANSLGVLQQDGVI